MGNGSVLQFSKQLYYSDIYGGGKCNEYRVRISDQPFLSAYQERILLLRKTTNLEIYPFLLLDGHGGTFKLESTVLGAIDYCSIPHDYSLRRCGIYL